MRLLMADDSPDDVMFVKRALSKTGFTEWFGSVSTGEEAIEYFAGRGKFQDRQEYPFPTVLLLDINMPGIGGFGVLEWLGEHPECKVIPTVVFSSSSIDLDVRRAYMAGANAYMVKPATLEELVRKMEVLHRFWSECEVPISSPAHACA